MPLSDYETALVTGASSGIGAAIATTLAARGTRVVAVARRADRLEDLARKTGCIPLALDISDTAAAIEAVRAHRPDIVVNNAGTGHGISGIADVAPEDIAAALRTNVEAPIQIVAAALAAMKERSRGHVVNIGSIAGLYPLVSAIYGAGKSALHRFGQNLRVELLGAGIRVTEVCPGRVASEFYDVAAGDEAALARMKQTGITELSPQDVADAVLFALDAPAHVNVGTIEITPLDQVIGGAPLTPAR